MYNYVVSDTDLEGPEGYGYFGATIWAQPPWRLPFTTLSCTLSFPPALPSVSPWPRHPQHVQLHGCYGPGGAGARRGVEKVLFSSSLLQLPALSHLSEACYFQRTAPRPP